MKFALPLLLLSLCPASYTAGAIFDQGATIETKFPAFDAVVPVDPLHRGLVIATFFTFRADSVSTDDWISVSYFENYDSLAPFATIDFSPFEGLALPSEPGGFPSAPEDFTFTLLTPQYVNPYFDAESGSGFVEDIRHWVDIEGRSVIEITSGSVNIESISYNLERDGYIYTAYSAIPEPSSYALAAAVVALTLTITSRRPKSNTQKEETTEPNHAMVPTPVAVTILACARIAPSTSAAHLVR